MKIAVLSRNKELYSTKRLIEAIEKRGAEPVLLDHLKCNLIIEQGAPHIDYAGETIQSIDGVIPRIGASVTFYGAAVIRQFEMMDSYTTVSSQALACSRDKLQSKQLLSSQGVGLPKTVFTNYSKDTDSILKTVGGTPVIIKLLEGTQGLGVVLAENKKAASSVIEAFNGLKARVIVQEFIKEAGGADLRVLVVGGKVVAAMKRQAKEGEFRSNLHRGGSSAVVRLSKAEREAAITATKVLGLSVAGVDMLQSARGPLILEVNSSPGLQGIERATGKDVAGLIVEHVMKQIQVKQEREERKKARRKPSGQ